MNVFRTFFSDYSYTLLIRSAAMLEIFFCVIFYTIPFKKAKHFPFRCAVFLICSACFVCPLAVFSTRSPGILTSVAITFAVYAYYFLVLCFLFQETLSELLLTICSGMATQIITGALIELIYLTAGKDPYQSLSFFSDITLPLWADWLIYHLLHLAVIVPLAMLFRRKKTSAHDRDTKRVIVAFSLAIAVITIPLTSYSRPLEQEHEGLAMVIRIFSILYGFLILFLRTGILEQSQAKQELRIMNELLYAEKKQFEDIKADMELINIRCHDIRNQLTQYAGKLTEHELDEIKSAIQIYDASIRTGSEILDIILYKRQPYCRQNQIQISCIADGNCLSFLSPSHQYSLFNNALENAIEAVMQLDNPDMRIISLTVGREHGLVVIHVTNYFKGGTVIIDNLPQTSKEDTSHHGFGVKSMRYIVQQYGGHISFETEDHIFYLNIYFPSSHEN